MKDAKGHGSNGKGGGMPIPGHSYHKLPSDSLRYIAKDAGEAERNVRSFDQQAASKYSDQIANAASVLGYRARGGTDYSPDGAAARELARGNPKADAAPVHPAMQTVGDFERGKPGFAAKRESLNEGPGKGRWSPKHFR